MPDIYPFSDGKLSPAQAMELAVLVDLESRWENLRVSASPATTGQPAIQMLYAKQKAYDAFRAKLAAYNKQYRNAHLAELPLNTPARLGLWCQTMRDLYTQLEQTPKVPFPTHLVEKAYRWANWVADKKGACRVGHANPPSTIREAVRDLEALIAWCADLAKIVPAA